MRFPHYGWKPSPFDPRDYLLQSYEHVAATPILPEVDPRGEHIYPVIYDQQDLGSCTANAGARALQYNLGLITGRKARRPSRLDIYYGERMLEGAPADQDTGAYGRDAFKFAQKTGWLYEWVWPYVTSTFAGPPPPGARHILLQPYAAVPATKTAIQQALSNKQFVIFGFSVFESFEWNATLNSGVIPSPSSRDLAAGSIGGHEMCIVGYLADFPDYALVANSWGRGLYQGVPGSALYGGGHCLMPWSYICGTYSSDWRTIVRPAA